MAIPEKKPYERLSDYLERSLPAELEAGKSRGKATADIIAKFNEEPPREMFAPFIWGATNASGSAGGGAGDADADAYLAAVTTAGGTTDATIDAAVQTLFTSLKSNGLYSKLDLFYPLIGGTAASTALNGIRTNSAYDITWNGSLTFNTLGVTGTGTNGDYGNTNYNWSTEAASNSVAWGIYNTAGNFGDNISEVYSHGGFDGTYLNTHVGTPTLMQLRGWQVAEPYGGTAIAVPKTSDGQAVGTFNTSTSTKKLYWNADVLGYLSGARVVSGGIGLANQTEFLFTLNINGNPYSGNYWNGRLSFFWIGEYLNDTEVETISQIITTFNTSLSRNVY